MKTSYEDLIRENAQKYYEDGTQQLSDVAFDALVDKVKEENSNSDVLKIGWGFKVNSAGKVAHKYGLVDSLEKAHNWDEIVKLINVQSQIDVSAKLDGLSAVIYFNEGTITKAVTRGDGEFGIDITSKMIHILGKDKIKDIEFTGAVRGELTMPVKEFKQFKQKHPEAKNSRNSTAGLINGDEITEDYKYIKFVVYSIIGDESAKYQKYYSYFGTLKYWFEDNFNDVAPRECIDLYHADYERRLEELKEKWSKDWYIDGVVLSNNSILKEGNRVIQTSCAFKFEDETAVTKIIDIEWNMSKNSEVIPVLKIEPVELEGTTVKRVTAFNAKFVQDNYLGSGATILVCKRNQIIPYVMEVIEPAEFPDLPITCGYCHEMLMWDENHVHLCCNNSKCVQKENEDLKAICLNLAPVDGLGWKTINKIFNNNFYYAHNYSFNDIEDLLNAEKIPGVVSNKGESGMFNLMLSKLQNDKFTVSQFLLSLNIPGLGKISAKRWEDSKNALNYFECIISGVMKHHDKIVKIVQDKNVVASLYTIYKDKFTKYYNLLKDRIIFNTVSIKKGKVCITGKLSMKRADFEEFLKQKGWELSNTVTKSVSYLITNALDSNTSKNRKADELGIQKVTEEEFINKCM